MDSLIRKACELGEKTAHCNVEVILNAIMWMEEKYRGSPNGKIAAMIAIITIGALATTPWSPIGDFVSSTVGSVDFLSICTLTLTVAGLSLGKDLPLLKTIGWKIVPVGIVAILASYLLSVVVAEFALGLWH